MYDENQTVTIKWNYKFKDWYEARGYIFTKRHDPFEVAVKDLTPHSAAKITAICDYCGAEYQTEYAVITNGRKVFPKDACAKCASKKVSEMTFKKRAKKHIDAARNLCKQYGYTLITTETDYTDARMYFSFICPKHGKQIMLLDNFLHGYKCAECAKNYVKEHIVELIENDTKNKLLNPQDYISIETCNLQIQCGCGNIYTTSYNRYRSSKKCCNQCSRKESSGELLIRKILERSNIRFIQEKRFKDCRHIYPLPFDFYLPDYNMIVEFDGQQHYTPIFGDENYNQTKENDNIKNKYCETNNIHLLRIPYWESSKIEEIISKELNIVI